MGSVLLLGSVFDVKAIGKIVTLVFLTSAHPPTDC